MKRTVSLILSLLLLTVLCPGSAETAEFFDRPSSVYQPAVAQQALTIAETCYTPLPQLLFMTGLGYTKVGEYNMKRPAGDTRHVVGYVLFEKRLSDGRTAAVIGVRGTGEGEWPLNMELMPSGDYDCAYAENFYLAARDVMDTQADYLNALEKPVFLVTGHSRGAAIANLLGAMLSDRFGPENVYAYTFASPRTVRGDIPAYDNIFNIVNPGDIVTYLPFPQWGFVRYGRDLILPTDTASETDREAVLAAYKARLDKLGEDITLLFSGAMAEKWTQAMTDLMPTVAESYTLRHALLHPGPAAEDEEGFTGWQLMEDLVSALLANSAERIQAVLAPVQGGNNDFSAAVEAIRTRMEAGGGAAVQSAHLPATYGAWLTVLRP